MKGREKSGSIMEKTEKSGYSREKRMTKIGMGWRSMGGRDRGVRKPNRRRVIGEEDEEKRWG